jgi:nucleoside phosphorylase
MEAGGVCAAAKMNSIQVVVVRGVSDLADPAKSDNVWRQRAMKTVAHLLESVDFRLLLAE